MVSMSLSTILYGTLLFSIIAYSLFHFLGPNYDPREPPVVPQTIPFIGHIIGLIRYGHGYFESLS